MGCNAGVGQNQVIHPQRYSVEMLTLITTYQ